MCYPDEIVGNQEELEEHFEEFEEIIRGGNGYLFFARNRVSRQEVAIKYYCGPPGEHRHDEPRMLASISSPNVLPILDARMISDEWGYFITKRCHEGDLDDFIFSNPSAHSAIDTAISICHGLSAIHAEGMLHRDIKPGNIVIDNGVPRIADFGSVRATEDDGMARGESQHTILYRPPESFDTNEYTRVGDIYQVGLVTYQLLGGYLPYNGEEYLNRQQRAEYNQIDDIVEKSIYIDNVIKERARSGSLVKLDSLPPWVSQAARRSLRKLLHPDPDSRVQSISDAVAEISQMRLSVDNWRWQDGVAYLSKGEVEYEVRPVGNEDYEVYQKRRAGFRRVPGTTRGSLSKVFKRGW